MASALLHVATKQTVLPSVELGIRVLRKLMKILLMFMVAAIASSSSFVIHIISVEWLPAWIGSQMQSITTQSSWAVRYVAGITSIEYGFAAAALYFLARDKLINYGFLKASLIFSVLLAAIHGAFIRQPFMDYMVGNPIHVVLVQNVFKWLVWLFMSFVIISGYELIFNKSRANKVI